MFTALLAMIVVLVPATEAGASPTRATAASSRVLRFNGIGKLKIGMKASALRRLGYRSSVGRYGCRNYYKPNGYQLIVSPSKRLISIDAYGNERTKAGIHIGSTLRQLRHAYRHDHIEYHLDHSFGQGSNGVLVRHKGRWMGFSLGYGTTRVDGMHVGIKRLVNDMEVYC